MVANVSPTQIVNKKDHYVRRCCCCCCASKQAHHQKSHNWRYSYESIKYLDSIHGVTMACYAPGCVRRVLIFEGFFYSVKINVEMDLPINVLLAVVITALPPKILIIPPKPLLSSPSFHPPTPSPIPIPAWCTTQSTISTIPSPQLVHHGLLKS